jgi:murein DD-endopeptidase MepM/ murein hydrolase activator NlpD
MEYLKNQKSIMAVTPSLWPVKGWVTSEFGGRISPFSGRDEFHSGMDIAAKLGNPIVAPADGVVVDVAKRADMGNMIVIHHARGISTSFAHLLRTVVKSGQVIRKGDVIGYVGSSGRSTGAHVHYSVLLNGVPVNPRKYLD